MRRGFWVHEFGILNQDVRIVHSIVIVIKLHDASHERIVGVCDIFNLVVVVVLDGDHDRLLEQVSRLHDRISKELPKVLHLLNSCELGVYLGTCLDVRISRTVVDRVANLFTASAADVLL